MLYVEHPAVPGGVRHIKSLARGSESLEMLEEGPSLRAKKE